MGIYKSDSPDALATAIQNLCRYEVNKKCSEVVFGKVTMVEESGAITITTFGGLEIGNARLVLSMFCKERIIHIPYDGSEEEDEDKDSHVHEEEEELDTMKFQFTPGAGVAALSITTNMADPADIVTLASTGCGTVKFKHKHKIKPALPAIKLWRGLEKGDIVVMSNLGNGVYYVHERAELSDGNSNEVLNPKQQGLPGTSKKYEV